MNNLLFDFSVDKAAKSVFITREFAAPLPLVWDAFTKQEILDQWWGPEPYKAVTKRMEFKVGGHRLYTMVGPQGGGRWALQEYAAISPKTHFTSINSFTDEDGNNITPGVTSSWEHHFSEQGGITKVRMVIKHQTLETLEKYIEMGFKEGFTVCLQQLEALVAKK